MIIIKWKIVVYINKDSNENRANLYGFSNIGKISMKIFKLFPEKTIKMYL